MEKDAEIRAKFKFVYGALLWHFRSLDRNWHTFEAAWSDDSGTTRLTGSFSFARLDGELRGLRDAPRQRTVVGDAHDHAAFAAHKGAFDR